MRTWTAEDLGGSVVIKCDGLRVAEMDVEDVGLFMDGDPDLIYGQLIADACNAAEYEATMVNPHDEMIDQARYFALQTLSLCGHAVIQPSEINDLGVMRPPLTPEQYDLLRSL